MELCSLLKCSTQLSLLPLAAFVARQRARHGLCVQHLFGRVSVDRGGVGLLAVLGWGLAQERSEPTPRSTCVDSCFACVDSRWQCVCVAVAAAKPCGLSNCCADQLLC